MTPKEKQRELIVEIMKADEKSGLYTTRKQTAVEWYEKEINYLFEKYEAKEISCADFIIMKHNIFYPAKEMEKQQMLEVSKEGIFSTHEFEQYYKETYE